MGILLGNKVCSCIQWKKHTALKLNIYSSTKLVKIQYVVAVDNSWG